MRLHEQTNERVKLCKKTDKRIKSYEETDKVELCKQTDKQVKLYKETYKEMKLWRLIKR